jgi:hypothetical protein
VVGTPAGATVLHVAIAHRALAIARPAAAVILAAVIPAAARVVVEAEAVIVVAVEVAAARVVAEVEAVPEVVEAEAEVTPTDTGANQGWLVR